MNVNVAFEGDDFQSTNVTVDHRWLATVIIEILVVVRIVYFRTLSGFSTAEVGLLSINKVSPVEMLFGHGIDCESSFNRLSRVHCDWASESFFLESPVEALIPYIGIRMVSFVLVGNLVFLGIMHTCFAVVDYILKMQSLTVWIKHLWSSSILTSMSEM